VGELELLHQSHALVSQLRQNLGRIVLDETAQDLDGSLPDLEILVLKTVEKHEQVLIPGDERIKLAV
jgi:hypothetical protein